MSDRHGDVRHDVHLLVDARPVDHPTARQRGIGRYVTGLLRGLGEVGASFTALVGSDVEAELLTDVVAPDQLVPWSRQAVRELAGPAQPASSTWYLATQLMLHPVPLDPIPSVITEAGLPVAAVMYDVIPYRHPDTYQAVPAARRLAQVRAPLARTVDALLAISEFAADTAAHELAYPREHVATIGAGVEPRFVPAATRAMPRPDRVLPPDVGRYVVSVTGGDERKNTHGLLQAWARLAPAGRASHRLVVVGAHDHLVLRRWERWAAEEGVAGEVVFTGAVTDDEMVGLLQGADLAVMPSVEEGFGLPVLEAAACGCPAICSGVSSLPEVLDEPSACFDPHDPDDIAAAIDRALTDPDHRATLLAAGERATERWTWSGVARDVLASLDYLGARFGRARRRPQTVVGVAGPFEGSPSGIGHYDVEVTAAIERVTAERAATSSSEPARADTAVPPDRLVRLVDTTGAPVPTGAGADRWPVRAVGRYVRPWDVDHLVAALGSSHHHVATAELAASVPCHVWLHEATLVGVHVGLAHMSGSPNWSQAHMRDQIERCRADSRRHLPTVRDAALLDPVRLAGAGITLLEETLARARSVIVSSDRALAEVRRVRPGGPPTLVLPLAHPPVVGDVTVPDGREIVALGWLDTNKAPVTAVEALAALVHRHGVDDARLTFVGAMVGDVADEVRAAARRRGVAGRIELTGRLDDERYRDRIAAARAGLQLRVVDRGEMSAAIADLLAHGVPTVSNLATAGAPSPGMQVVGLDADRLADALVPLLTDDEAWADAAADALARAAAWTFDDVARSLLAWLDEADDLPAGAVRRVGADRARE
ncbi:MAG: glycosyltransferase family 1 protein [Ilumatobacteraceae bacterium]